MLDYREELLKMFTLFHVKKKRGEECCSGVVYRLAIVFKERCKSYDITMTCIPEQQEKNSLTKN